MRRLSAGVGARFAAKTLAAACALAVAAQARAQEPALQEGLSSVPATCIEAHRDVSAGYLEERLQSVAIGLARRLDDPEARIPARLWRAARGVYLFEQWQAGHLITTQVCVGVGFARKGGGWSRCAFYRAFDLGAGLAEGTRQARRFVLLMMSGKARALMELPRWNLKEFAASGGDVRIGPRGAGAEPPEGVDIWVYDDSADALEQGAPYVWDGSILDNPWATAALYGAGAPLAAADALGVEDTEIPPPLRPLRAALDRALESGN